MLMELVYLGLAYIICVGILWKYAFPAIKILSKNQIATLHERFESLDNTILFMKENYEIKQAKLIQTENKMHIMHESLDNMMQKHRKIIEQKHEMVLMRYKKQYIDNFLECLKQQALAELNEYVKIRLMDMVSIELKKTTCMLEVCMLDLVDRLNNMEEKKTLHFS